MGIARHFNAGWLSPRDIVPKGRLKKRLGQGGQPFGRPFGTPKNHGGWDPALKCRAIFMNPFGVNTPFPYLIEDSDRRF